MRFRKIRRPVSIGAKLLISHISLALCVILLASVLSYMLTYQYVRQARIRDLVSKAEHVAGSGAVTQESGFAASRRLVNMVQDLTNAKVFFLDADSESIRMSRYRQDPPGEEAEFQWVDLADSIDREFAARVLAGEKVSAVQQFAFAEGVILFAGVPILSEDGKVLGGVILAQPVDQLLSLTRAIRLMLTVVVGISLLLAAVLSLELTRRLVRPIERITRAARRMTDGTYAERITSLPDDEIGEMGRALNCMSGRLMDVIRNLRKERDKLELVVSGIQEGLVAVDSHWRIVHANDAFLELTELDEIGELRKSQIEGLPALREALNACIGSGRREQMEWSNPSGRALCAEAAPISDENGTILGAVCLVRDISEAQRMEQLRRDYVANISHELRTPLTGIRGMVEPLIDGCMETEEERMDCYQVILRETIRLEKLVGEMLDMSRLQDGRVTVELEKLELPGILEAAVRSMQPLAEEAGVALTLETDGSALECMGNEDRITQVLVILIDNALSFTPPGGSVKVFGRQAGREVLLGVRDTGCGIEPKDQPLIWERFYKADKSRMRTTGTGLGLSIAKLVVELMGGRISVKSEPGKGAKFTFTLNRASQPQESAQ